MWFSLFMYVLFSHVNFLKGSKVILVMVDGCRWDYPLTDFSLPGFKKIAENGVRSDYMTPIFPSITYPNWLTLVTGLYAESHGFVDNIMYDPEYDDFFFMAPNDTAFVPHWWNKIEPLWITAEKNGLKTAMYWWDGCKVEIQGRKPKVCEPYKYVNESAETEEAFSSTVKLMETNNIQLSLIYYEMVDHNGHDFGPDSRERKAALKSIDSILDNLQTELDAKGLSNQIDIVVVSDHGMKFMDPKKLIFIDLPKHVDISLIKYMFSYGPFAMIFPEDNRSEKLYLALKNIAGLTVYKKEEIPEKYHLKHHPRTMPLLIMPHSGYFIQKLGHPAKDSIFGTHGFDPDQEPDMRGIFYARGPSFKENYVNGPLQEVDVYNVLCYSLGIQPLPNNGSIARVQSMWKESINKASKLSNGTILVLTVLCLKLFYIF